MGSSLVVAPAKQKYIYITCPREARGLSLVGFWAADRRSPRSSGCKVSRQPAQPIYSTQGGLGASPSPAGGGDLGWWARYASRYSPCVAGICCFSVTRIYAFPE